MKKPELKMNSAGGLDLLVERDAGNPVRILTGKRSKEFFLQLKDVCEDAIYLLDNPEIINKVIRLFKKSGDQETEKIKLDNLDRAKLTYDGNGDVVVENEHGTQFAVYELSAAELDIFLYILNK